RKLAEGADVLIYDAQYTPDEYTASKKGWGHSTWREAVNIVMESGAKELILFHHDPDHPDAAIDSIVSEARNHYPAVRAAAEGMELPLSRAPGPLAAQSLLTPDLLGTAVEGARQPTAFSAAIFLGGLMRRLVAGRLRGRLFWELLGFVGRRRVLGRHF